MTNSKHFQLIPSTIAAIHYYSLLLQLLIILTAGDSPPSPPFDEIAIDCGSGVDTTTQDLRNWTTDFTSKLSFLDPTKASMIFSAIKPPSETVPYLTARLSPSSFTYIFPVSAGPKFLRLYFYSASYANFSSSTAFFSVKAGHFTLLSNFSSAIYAQVGGSDEFFKEYCLTVEDGHTLNLTFTPTPNMSDSYAFINGIEIVSIPAYLIYTAPGDQPDLGYKYLDGNNFFRIENNTGLELMHRINVGGNHITPQNDNRMFRTWNTDDSDYLVNADIGIPISNDTIKLQYRDDIFRFSAPEMVYRTARLMNLNQNNLTWTFQVDNNFTYLVRLHFCELVPEVTKVQDRVFWIYINHQSAESNADVVHMSGGNGFPVFKDYGVTIGPSSGNQKVQNLFIELHPRADISSYYGVILNGIEIFKLSNNYDKNLAGLNFDIPLTTQPTTTTNGPKSSNSSRNGIRIGAFIGGSVSGLAVLSLILFLVFRRRRLGVKDTSNGGGSLFGPFSILTTKNQSSSTLPIDICRQFSLSEILDATNNFNDLCIIGVGGFGNVYKGLINNGATTVAIKRLKKGSAQGAHEFKTEIEMLSQLRHVNLVSLIGYCYEDNEMVLVYDYMAGGTLRDHLYKTGNPPLPWTQRLEICIGAAHGLHYLHSGAKNKVIHRDVKSTNILLDERLVAKVSDFGLSKIGPNSMSKQHISTVVKGSFGYLDPEYFMLNRLTEKSDVYSFGVVLCEVLCGKPPVCRSTVEQPASLAEWVRRCYRKGNLGDILDPYLQGKIAEDCLRKFTEVATNCLLEKGAERPSMGDVVWGLEFALQLQETASKQSQLQTEIDSESLLNVSSVAETSEYLFSDSGSAAAIGSWLSEKTFSSHEQSFLINNSDKAMSSVVFSEIMNPKGR